jgi:multiple sugar transport system permease protein
MFNLSYYARNRIRHYLIHVVMIALLVITLFPIGWMVFTSLKENTDILVGKIPFSHAHNDVMQTIIDGEYLWVLTSDGGINKFEKEGFKLLDYTSCQTSTTNFAVDDEYIWVSSANRGITRVDRSNLKDKKDFKLPLGDYDRAKVVATSVVRNKDKLWFSMQYRGYEGLIEFDTNKLEVSRVFDLKNQFSPIQVRCLKKMGQTLWIGTDKGIIKFDIAKGEIDAIFSVSAYLPAGPVQMDIYGDNLIVSGVTGAHLFSVKEGKVTRSFTDLETKVQSVLVKDDYIFLGTASELIVHDVNTGKTTRYTDLFNAVNEKNYVIKDEFAAAEVSAIAKNGKDLYLGSSLGRLTEFDFKDKEIVATAESKKGHLVISWINYIDMWRNVDFGLYLRNSFVICGTAMFFAMVFATMGAYAISRFKFPGAHVFSMGILATQMVPGIMFLIPIYSMFVKFYEYTGIPLKGTYFGMIFMYSAFFIPFSIWILRGFFAAIPVELEEAARIDGASPLQVFWHVVLPLAIPGIIATGIYVFLTAWDELMFAWVLTSADTMTIPVGIRNFVGNYQNRFDLIMAAATVATVPVMILFFLLQKHIVKGLTAGAVKG